MTNVIDLHIQKEIIPLFDFTLNDFSRNILTDFFKTTLSSKEEIIERQQILKGFMSNEALLENYFYARIEFFEVYHFLKNYFCINTSNTRLRIRLLLSEKERYQTMSKHIQFVFLFHKLKSQVDKINTHNFPDSYKREIQYLHEFLNSFQIDQYERAVQEQKFTTKGLVNLMNTISQKMNKKEFETFWEKFFLFETYISISTAMLTYRFSFPAFSETNFCFEELYHPLLKDPVKNCFTTKSNVVLLTGPNMSGKSTFLKAVGLAVYLAHLGVGVAASKAEMPFFESILIFVNLNDNLLSGYSHFMTEVINLKNVVTEVRNNKKCFAVFDELFRGTNIEDAVEISTTTIKGLSGFKNSYFFISTHLLQLTEIEQVKTNEINTIYIDCEIKNNIPVFTYQLKKGCSNLKVGRMLFEKEGLNALLNCTENY